MEGMMPNLPKPVRMHRVSRTHMATRLNRKKPEALKPEALEPAALKAAAKKAREAAKAL